VRILATTAGRGDCTPRTTRRSAGRSTCSSAWRATSRSTAALVHCHARRSRTGRWTASAALGAASPCNIAWRIRASISSTVRRRRGGGDTTSSPECSRRAFASPPALTPPGGLLQSWVSLAWLVTARQLAACDSTRAQLPRRETAPQDVDRERHLVPPTRRARRVAIQVGSLPISRSRRDYFACPETEIADITAQPHHGRRARSLRCRRIRAP